MTEGNWQERALQQVSAVVRAALPTETYTPMELKVSAMEKHTV
jgi:hypothetical protein